MSNLRRAAAFAVLLATTSACARLHARSVGPPLDTPAPPPRIIVPIESQPIVVSPPVEDVPAPQPERTPARPAPSRVERTEPAPTAPAPRTPAADAAEPRTLQTTANPVEAEQKTRVVIATARRDLGQIDYRALGAEAKAQFDIANRFIEQAEDALKAKNLVFAEQLANKAATLATLLQKR